MLALKNRLRHQKDIDRVFKLGRSSREGAFLLKTLKNDLPDSRLGFIVSQKVAKKAVWRNKIKRRLRAVAAQLLPNIQNGVDYLLVALPGANQGYAEISESVYKLFNKSGYFKKKHLISQR